jgi:hypothetical protein
MGRMGDYHRPSATGSMMASQDTVASPAPAALAAFLRGCERRGAVFAELQCGDPDHGDVALAAALRAFRGNAAALPMADWPARFWSLLAAAPPLRTTTAGARWSGALSALAAAAPLDRAALLLRLAGGLQEADAAAALGLDGAAYRDALARACPRDALGHPDAAAWRAVAEAIQAQLRELPPDRLAKLARLREDALAGVRVPAVVPVKVPESGNVDAGRRWPWILLAGILLLAAAGAALWWWQGQAPPPAPTPTGAPAAEEGVSALPPDPVITSAPLPAAEAPALRADNMIAAEAHGDFALLADADDEAYAREADFLAWYVAGVGATSATAAPNPDAGAAADAAR